MCAITQHKQTGRQAIPLILALIVFISLILIKAQPIYAQGKLPDELYQGIRQHKQEQLVQQIQEFTKPIKQRQDALTKLDEEIAKLITQYKGLHNYPTQLINYTKVNSIKQSNPSVTTTLTDEEIDLASRIGVTYFGDSLVAGSQSQFQQLFKNSNVYGVGGMQIAPDGMTYLRQLLEQNAVAPVIIIVLGTNRGLEGYELDEMVQVLQDRQIFFVDTISHVGHRSQVSSEIQQVATRYPHVHAINFSSQEQASYYDSDMIHHSNTGKQALVQYIAKNVYQTYFSEPDTSRFE